MQEYYDKFKSALINFMAAAAGEKVAVVVAYIPDSVQLNDDAMQDVNRYLADLCKNLSIPFVDTTPILEAQKDLRSLYLFPFDAHNSPAGLKLIAEAIGEKLELQVYPPRQRTDKPPAGPQATRAVEILDVLE